jgi:chloride channel protein, CIC family
MKNVFKDYKPKINFISLEYLSGRRHGLMAPAIFIGVFTGAITVSFHICVDLGETFRNQLIAMLHQHQTAGPLMMFAMVMLAVIISVGLVIHFAPEASGSGIPHLKGVLLGNRNFRWFRVLLIKFLSTVIGSTGGLVLGRAGPCVHMGSAIGQGLSNFWSRKAKLDQDILVAAGGGAGLAAAFNAPLSGLIFVLEELDRRCASLEFFAAAVACLSADMVCRAFLGQHSTFHFTITGAPPLHVLVAFVPLGILSAILGVLFTRSILWSQKLAVMSIWSRFVGWLILTILITVTAWFTPELLGGGLHFANEILADHEQFSLTVIGFYFLIRFVLTIGSASSGAAGGIFMPILVLGALLGWGVGESTQFLFPEFKVDSKLFAVVGMAAYFSGIVQAPLTGIVLIIEMTQDYELILPLFIACFTAFLVSDWMGSSPIYEALLKLGLQQDNKPLATSNYSKNSI